MASSSSLPPIVGTDSSSRTTTPVNAWLDLSYPNGLSNQQSFTGNNKDSLEKVELIMSKIHDQVAYVDLSNHRLGDQIAKMLAIRLRKNQTLVSINFSKNEISPDAINKIFTILFGTDKEKFGKTFPTELGDDLVNQPPNRSLSYIFFDNKEDCKECFRNRSNANFLTALFATNAFIGIPDSKLKEIIEFTGVSPLAFINVFNIDLKCSPKKKLTRKFPELVGISLNIFNKGKTIKARWKSGKQVQKQTISFQMTSIFNKTLLHVAAMSEIPSTLENFLDRKLGWKPVPNVNISIPSSNNIRDRERLTPLYCTVVAGRHTSQSTQTTLNEATRNSMDLLIKRGAIVDNSQSNSMSPLNGAVLLGNSDRDCSFLSFLLEKSWETRPSIGYLLDIYGPLQNAIKKHTDSWGKISTENAISTILTFISNHFPQNQTEVEARCLLNNLLDVWNFARGWVDYLSSWERGFGDDSQVGKSFEVCTRALLEHFKSSPLLSLHQIIIGDNSAQNKYDSSKNITPCLITAVRGNNLVAAKLLLGYGAEANMWVSSYQTQSRDKFGLEEGFSALHYAVRHWNLEMIKLLLANGAVRSRVISGFSLTPLGLAKYILEEVKNQNSINSRGSGWTAPQNVEEIIQLLEIADAPTPPSIIPPPLIPTSSSSSSSPVQTSHAREAWVLFSEGERTPALIKQVEEILSQGIDENAPETQTLLQDAVQNGCIGVVKALANAGANLNELINLGLDSAPKEVSGSIVHDHEATTKFLIFNQFITCGFKSEEGQKTLADMNNSPDPAIKELGRAIESLTQSLYNTVSSLEGKIEEQRRVLEGHDETIKKLCELLHLDLETKLSQFFDGENGEYFRCFHHKFSNYMNIMLDGIHVAQSPFVQDVESTVTRMTSEIATALSPAANVFAPGGGIVVKGFAALIKYYPQKLHEARLQGVSRLFESIVESTLFTRMLSCHLMGILQKLLILMDKVDKESHSVGYKVHDKAIDRLAFNLTVRIIDYMFIHHLQPEKPWSLKNEKSIYKFCREVALSIHCHDPKGWRTIESLDGVVMKTINRIIKLPYEGILTDLQKIKMNISDLPKTISGFPGRLKKWFENQKKEEQLLRASEQGESNATKQQRARQMLNRRTCLTAEGCFQRAPLGYEKQSDPPVFYQPVKDFRPEKYPLLTLSPFDVSHIQRVSCSEEGRPAFEMTREYSEEKRLAKSYREISLLYTQAYGDELSLSTIPSPSAMPSDLKQQVPRATKPEVVYAGPEIAKIRAEIMNEVQQKFIRQIERKINKLHLYPSDKRALKITKILEEIDEEIEEDPGTPNRQKLDQLRERALACADAGSTSSPTSSSR